METYTKISDTEAEISRTEIIKERVNIVELRAEREKISMRIDDIRTISTKEIARLQAEKDIITAKIQQLKDVGVV